MSFKERTDVTAVPAMGVVAETMVALVLADEALNTSLAATPSTSSAATTPPTWSRSQRQARASG